MVLFFPERRLFGMNRDMETTIAGVRLKNPVTTASGTFESGREYGDLIDLNHLGAITVKGVSDEAWKGNPVPRIAETSNGLLNSVGLQNAGAKHFIENDIPFLRQYDTKIIVNICGHTLAQYCSVAERFVDCDIDLLELNISCPNVEEGGLNFGTDPHVVERVVSAVRHYAKQPLIVKLSPEVSDITEIAKAAVSGGADAISLINTIKGMKIDIRKRKAVLANKIGGYSGPGIMPVALRMVYEVCKCVNVPVIGMGGISTYEDALGFIMEGATAVAVGTANFYNPYAIIEIIDGIGRYMEENQISSLEEIRGCID